MENKYKEAMQRLQLEVSTYNTDIVVLRELVDKATPKQMKKLSNDESEDRYYCCTCMKRQSLISIRKRHYCEKCGQLLDPFKKGE